MRSRSNHHRLLALLALAFQVSLPLPVYAQAAWVQRAGGPEMDTGVALAVDALGALYVTGFFRGGADFDGDGTAEVTSAGLDDVFVAKYDAEGDLLWVRRAGGANPDFCNGLALDATGGVYVTGEFIGSADFDGDGAADVTSAGLDDIFIARYDAAGDLLWVRRAGGALSDRSFAVAADGSGGLYVTGTFEGSADFDGDGEADVTSAGDDDVFLVRYNAEGDLHWLRRAGAVHRDYGIGVAVDAAGAPYIMGEFRDGVDFDGDGATDVTSVGMADIFIARYGAEGDVRWVQRAGGPGAEHGIGIAVDDAGGLFITGTFEGDTDFDGDGAVDVVSAGRTDIFIARYDTEGDLHWVRRAGGPHFDGSVGLATDGAGGLYVSGAFRDGADFDGDGAADVESVGKTDIFIARYDADGALRWVQRAGGEETDTGAGLAVDATGTLYLAGTFERTADFDDDGLADISSAGGSDLFFAQYDDPGTPTNVGGEAERPGDSFLKSAYPNPFHQATTIPFALPEQAHVQLIVYDVLGREIARLLDAERPAGRHAVVWDASHLTGGMYLYHLTAGAFRQVRQMVLVK